MIDERDAAEGESEPDGLTLPGDVEVEELVELLLLPTLLFHGRTLGRRRVVLGGKRRRRRSGAGCVSHFGRDRVRAGRDGAKVVDEASIARVRTVVLEDEY